jgi:imidazoleglycerol-phosphate dehydratase / histidinol-phosphatase
MKKVLFIDRDGTIIWEPPDIFQVDSLEKLEFIPGAITFLRKIVDELDYELVMVTNQDGLGTKAYPEKAFELVQSKMMKTLEGEGIRFAKVCVDRSFEHENKPTRKPGTGMLTKYMNGDYDLANSFVIGDRITDVKLAHNLGCKSILIQNYDSTEGWENQINLVAENWEKIYLRAPEITAPGSFPLPRNGRNLHRTAPRARSGWGVKNSYRCAFF